MAEPHDAETTDPHLVVGVVELTRRVGSRRALVASTVLHVPPVAGVAVPEDRSVTVDLVLESMLDGIAVSGTLTAPWAGECRRCLDPLEGTVDIEVHEVFEHEHTPGETYPIEGDHVDLNPLVRDAVLLGLPHSLLCRASCAGPDPDRFPTSVEDSDGGQDEAEPTAGGDPRWAALDALRFDD